MSVDLAHHEIFHAKDGKDGIRGFDVSINSWYSNIDKMSHGGRQQHLQRASNKKWSVLRRFCKDPYDYV